MSEIPSDLYLAISSSVLNWLTDEHFNACSKQSSESNINELFPSTANVVSIVI